MFLDDVTAEYHRLNPQRNWRPVPYSDVELAIISAIEKRLAYQPPAASTSGGEPQDA